VGGGDDGGIDGFFILLDGDLLSEKILNIDRIRKNPDIDLYIIQSKNTDSFREDVFAKLLASSKDIFNLHKSNTDLKKNYNTTLVEKISIFRSTYRDLLSKYPNLKIFFCYASKGNCNRIHVKVKEISKKLIDEVKKYLPSSLVEIKFYGARELLDLSRKEKPYTLEMDFFENLSRGKNDYLVLSSLYNYYNFIKDENSNLRKYLFESNVRDYYGKNEVNKDIIETINKLDSQGLEGDIDFWWLNNGITILASKAAISGKTIVLDNVLIVNGLQTTRCLYDCLKNSSQVYWTL